MTTKFMTPSRFSSSYSGTQQIYAPSAPSMADTLPSVDFNFEDLRQRMKQFTDRFDDFIERGRKRVLEERNTFRMTVADVQEQQRQRKQAISDLESKSSNHAHIIAREAQEAQEMHEAVTSLKAEKDDNIVRRDKIKAEIAAVQSAIKQRREAQTAHQRALSVQARHNAPELRFWENCLGMRMEASGVEDTIKFVFMCIDEQDAERECWFELKIGSREYEVTATKPKLDRDEVDDMTERLNESKELGDFIKNIRTMFAQTIRK